MRTSILSAAFLGLFAIGCAGELTDQGGGDDVQPPEGCGDGVTGAGETCDDGNTTSGDGCSSVCQMEGQQGTPRVTIALDKTSLTTDLLVDNEINVTLTSVDGFAGNVTLAATVDNAGTAVMGWTTTLDTATVVLTAEGTGTAKLTLRVPSDSATLMGDVKIAATSSADPVTATLPVTANPVAVVTYTTTGNNCVYPTEFNISAPIRLKVGRALRVVNGSDPAGTGCGGGPCGMQIHFDGGSGIAHQNAPMAAGANYERTATVENSTGVTFYCHNANQTTVAVEGSPQSTRQRLITVP